jgi:hypothetical protein
LLGQLLMVQCPACRESYVTNTVFCPECGLYLLQSEQISTSPLDTGKPGWDRGASSGADSPGTGLQTIRLRICVPRAGTDPFASRSRFRISRPSLLGGQESRPKHGGASAREVEVPLAKPIRLGRVDPKEGVYPDVDLTDDLAMEYGVSREHACIFRRGNNVEVEDLASTNGTMLNGTRLAPYLPVSLNDGDQLQLGMLLIEVSFGANRRRNTTTETGVASAVTH